MNKGPGNSSRRAFWESRAGSWLALFAIYTILTLFFAAVSFIDLAIGGQHSDPAKIFLWNGTRFYLWAFLSPLVIHLAHRYRLDRTTWLKLAPLHFLASVVWSLIHASLNLTIYWSTAAPEARRLVPSLVARAQGMGETFALGVLVYWIVLFAVYGIDSYRHYQQERLRNAHLESELAQAQLSALKMQLQPHFLFNTLHSLTDLVLEDPEAATKMIARLGDFLRHTIEGPSRAIISLEEELEFVHSYLEIEKVRFQDRLEVALEIAPETRRAQVPNLILQPLVENAIRHGLSARRGRGRLLISARRYNEKLEITITDNGAGLTNGNGEGRQSGVGLSNTRSRLRHLYGDRQSLQLRSEAPEGTRVTLLFPFDVGLSAPPENGVIA
ncbi:MAG: histidine kinase [Chthoniobacterales bacterium]|nr:histidine kinase [Chthoniobacterales bacterium]